MDDDDVCMYVCTYVCLYECTIKITQQSNSSSISLTVQQSYDNLFVFCLIYFCCELLFLWYYLYFQKCGPNL